MKWTIFLAIFLMLVITSCYKDNATYTTEVKGYGEKYTISYLDKHGDWVENQVVDKGYCLYVEHSSDWRLKINVKSDSTIIVNIYKREDLIKTFTNVDTLSINTVINH